jgi:phosphonate transport system substrate-binding protein
VTIRSIFTYSWLVVTAWLLMACTGLQAASLPEVDLAQRTALPAVASAAPRPLRLAVAAILSPQGTADSYQELADYLSAALDRPVELVQRRTYAEINALIADNQVDLAFVCTSAYLDGAANLTMDLLAAPIIEGESVYRAQLIVPRASPAASMADLRGQTFAFTDPMSLSGRVYPTFLVQQLGAQPDAFFANIFFTYSHDRAIEAVAAGVADGAAVDSLVLRYALVRDPALAAKIKIIHTSPPFGIPPVVVPASLPARQKVQLQDLLLKMHEDAGGRRVLAHLGIDRFTTIGGQAYASARVLVTQTQVDPTLPAEVTR